MEGMADEWKFTLDDLEEDEDEKPEELEPGSPTRENTLFVVLGALTTLLVLARLVFVV